MQFRTSTLSWAALLAVSVAPAASAATLFTNLYVFGDSLSDVGNTSLATAGAKPGAGYYDGRYSNGPIWVETLAGKLGMPALTTSITGGNDYAFAGANTASGGQVPATIQVQAGMFLSSKTFLSSDLVVVWGGANDFFTGQTNPTIPAGNMANVITTLAGGGAKNFLLLNLPDLGDLPETLAAGPAAIAGAHALTLGFNNSLAAAAADLVAGNPSLRIWQLDIFGIGKELQADPGKFGITNLTDGALTSGHAADAATYAYWDGVHPTATTHNLFAERAYSMVPEPSAVMMLWVFGSGLLLRRGRTCG